MEFEQNVGGRDRLARAILAVGLGIVAIGAWNAGKRPVGFLAVMGALAFGFNAITCFCGVNETLGIDTTDE